MRYGYNPPSNGLFLKILCILYFPAFILFLTFFPGISGYSEGTRHGTVVKLSKKGFINKTWEGEMNLGQVRANKEGQLTPSVWEFSVSSDEVAKQLLDSLEKNAGVSVKYKETAARGSYWFSTNYDIVEVKQHD